jgi:hypothetical protein
MPASRGEFLGKEGREEPEDPAAEREDGETG